MKVLVIAEHDNSRLAAATVSVLSAALKLTSAADMLVAGYRCEPVAAQGARMAGVSCVKKVDANHYERFGAENLAFVVAQLAGGYSHVLFPGSVFGKDLAPRVAAMLDVAPISDVTEIVDAQTFVHPVYAGHLLETVSCCEPVKVLTVRTTAFPAIAASQDAALVQNVSPGPDMGVKKWLRREAGSADQPSLLSAQVVVAGGRGLGNAAQFEALLKPLAARLGAAIGATRVAVDGSFSGNESQIGQTGKTVAPAVYVAIGISGAAQHVAGMRESGWVVAINKDPEAPIFRVADLGFVGDLNEIVPKLTEALGEG
jgi:electron transfer flavoprotein alpha subunit